MPKFLTVFWALIIVFTSSYFRLREGVDAPTIDWLILTQVALCLLGMTIAAPRLLSFRNRPQYAWVAALYVGAVGVGLPWSVNPVVSFGYFILLAGGILTTLGLVQRDDSLDLLLHKEAFLTGVFIFCLVKDVVLAFTVAVETDTGRLGMGLTSANSLGLLAVLTFLMLLGRRGHPFVRHILQSLCVVVLVLTESRGSSISFLTGVAVYSWKAARWRPRGGMLKFGAASLIIAVTLVAVFLYSNEFPGIESVVRTINRNEDRQSMESLTTGRTIVWKAALQILRKEHLSSLIFGNGYGLSRVVLNQNNSEKDYYFKHAHNTVLEALISVGLVGTAALAVLCGAALTAVGRRRSRAPHPISSRAAAVICAVLVTFPTEAYFSTKIGFYHIAFIFYLCVLCVPFCQRRETGHSMSRSAIVVL